MLRCLLGCISSCCFRKEGKRIADSLLTASLFCFALLVAADEYLVTTLGEKNVLVLCLGFRTPSPGGWDRKCHSLALALS